MIILCVLKWRREAFETAADTCLWFRLIWKRKKLTRIEKKNWNLNPPSNAVVCVHFAFHPTFARVFLSAPHHNDSFLCQVLFPWPVNDKFLLILPQWWDFHSHSRLRERFSFPPFPQEEKNIFHWKNAAQRNLFLPHQEWRSENYVFQDKETDRYKITYIS